MSYMNVKRFHIRCRIRPGPRGFRVDSELISNVNRLSPRREFAVLWDSVTAYFQTISQALCYCDAIQSGTKAKLESHENVLARDNCWNLGTEARKHYLAIIKRERKADREANGIT